MTSPASGLLERGIVPSRGWSFWVSISSAVISIVALPLSIYFFLASRSAPELTYAINPGRSVIASTSDSLPLTVQYRGEAIRGSVVVARIALWNAGTAPVHREDILSRDITIHLAPDARILQLTVDSVSTQFSELSATMNDSTRNSAAVRWRVLEPGDGALLQLVYEGSPGDSLHLSGTVVGQRAMRHLELSAPREPEPREKSFRLLGIMGMCAGLLALILLFIRARRQSRVVTGMSGFVLRAVMIVYGVGGTVLYALSLLQPKSPVGF